MPRETALAESFGTYTPVRRIDRGIGAEVWKAVRRGPGGFEKILALKKVRAELASDAVFIEETALVAQLVHPNVVQVFDFETGESGSFMTMEYVPGCDLGTLRDACRRNDVALETDEALHLVLETIRGLRAAHERTALATGTDACVVHRGVSPDNILLSWNGDVKVSDFCTSRSIADDVDDPRLRERLAWMSPEQAGAVALDSRSDLFSAALILYELVAGRRLFAADSADALLWRIVAWEGIADEDLARLPAGLRPVLATALQPRPEDRFANAKELEEALVGLLPEARARRARASLAARLAELFASERAAELAPAPGALFAWDETTSEDPQLRYFFDREEQSTRRVLVDPVGIARPIPRRLRKVAVLAGLLVVVAAALVLGEQADRTAIGPPGVSAVRAQSVSP